ncbi:hypothetical protein BN1080_00881 [Planococcus massiliensis]|uniref:Uncharacterized protein n=1 Tax=Planococcus massiliensis TaxID=1499687 RepID=A0A098EKY8_9BACL|nr:hypothetical protein BN1080_00881 [Planococcus massiliensis]
MNFEKVLELELGDLALGLVGSTIFMFMLTIFTAL